MWTDGNGKAVATFHNFAKVFPPPPHACSVWWQFLFEKAPVCPVYQQMLNKNSQVS